MNAVHGSIIENLRAIEIVYEDTVDVFKGDRTNTSDSRELSVNKFIESYLPSDFQVKIRSKIYSKTEETNNIDCVILSPNHPKLITPIREIVLAEGVFAAIEIKPDISTLTDKSEFYRGLCQIKSIKNVNRKIDRLDTSKLTGKANLPKYFDKIPCALFTSKSASIEKTVNFIKQKIEQDKLDFEELPDLIVCLDRGILLYSPFLQMLPISENLKRNAVSVPEKGFITFESSDKVFNLITFLKLLLSFSMPTIQLSEFIVKPYLDEVPMKMNHKIYEIKKISLQSN